MKKLLIALLLFAQVSVAQTVDIVVLGSKYKNPSEKAQFINDVAIAKYEFELRFAYRKSQFVWHTGTSGGNYSCAIEDNETIGANTLICDSYQAIYKEAASVYADYDFVILLVNKMGSGSGGETPMIGTGNHTFIPAAMGSKVLHETGHSVLWLGFEHVQGTIMGHATSGGNALINMTFSLEQQEIANASIDAMAGTYQIDEPLDITIESPYNGQTFSTSSYITFWANTNYDDNVYRYQIIVTQEEDEGYLIGEFILWERNKWNTQFDIKRDIGMLPAGNYMIEIRLFNAVGSMCAESVTINVE